MNIHRDHRHDICRETGHECAREWAAAGADLYVVIGQGARELDAALKAASARKFAVVIAAKPTDSPDDLARAVYEVASAPGFLPHKIACVVHPAEMAAHGARIANLSAAANAGAERYFVSVNTFAAHARRFVYHTLRNVEWLPDSISFAAAKGRFSGVPAVVVAAGPSLVDSLPALKTASETALIVACDTAAPALISAGIAPDVIAAIDLQPRKARVLRALNGHTRAVLAQMQYCHPRLSAAWRGPRMWLGAPSAAARLLPAIAAVPETLSVAHAAFFVAREFGCSPIVFTGLDLAFTAGHRTHAPGTFGHWGEIGGPRADAIVPGLDGREWPTLHSMRAMATSFAAAIAETDVPVWNATARGQLIAGAKRRTLADLNSIPSPVSGLTPKPLAKPLLEPILANHRLAVTIADSIAALNAAAENPPSDLLEMAAFASTFRTRTFTADAEADAQNFVAKCCRIAARKLRQRARRR